MAKNAEYNQRFYVYALANSSSGLFQSRDVFYVGKGTGRRYRSHLDEAIRQNSLNPKLLTPKQKKICELPEGEYDKHVFIFASELSEEDAWTVEAALIASLTADGVKLTNKVKGRHNEKVLRRVPEVRAFIGSEPLDVEEISIGELNNSSNAKLKGKLIRILVKGTDDDANRYGVKYKKQVPGVPYSAKYAEVNKKTEKKGRGWNIRDPWTDEEARERAARYWPIGRANVEAIALMQSLAKDGRLQLGLLIKDQGATVLRYLWQVDDLPWEQYEWDKQHFGFPLGESIEKDKWLGCELRCHDAGFFLNKQDGIGFAIADVKKIA